MTITGVWCKSTTALYTQVEVRALLNEYITSKQLLNSRDKAYVNISTDQALLETLSDGKSKEKDRLQEVAFMKRDELLTRLLEKMQAWYEIRGEGKETVVKSGTPFCSPPI
jgi:translation initiation factor 2D